MILFHTIKGQVVAINGGLIERVEQDGETHVTLVTGTSYLVREELDDVIALHREDRARVRALALKLAKAQAAPTTMEDSAEDVEPVESGVVQLFGHDAHRREIR